MEMMESPVRFTESLTTLPVEYWEREGTIYGALVDNVSADGLLILSVNDIPIGSRLNVRILYANEYELDGIKAVANIVRKDLHIAKDLKGYKYALEFVQMSEEDRRKLTNILNSDLKCEEISGREDITLGNPSLEKASSSPPFPDLDLTTESTGNCKFYKNGKCLNTHAFCDLCHNEDETFLVQRTSTIQKSRSHWSSTFTSGLAN
jgi:PilZ domain